MRECPRLSSLLPDGGSPLFTQGEFHSPPRPALPLRSSECLLTHPEKASLMARRLPPPEEFRGAGPAGRQGADGPGACPLDGRVVLDSPARLASCKLTSLPISVPGEEARWPLPPHRPGRNAGPLRITPARGLEDGVGGGRRGDSRSLAEGAGLRNPIRRTKRREGQPRAVAAGPKLAKHQS